jgi:hypothetical protein
MSNDVRSPYQAASRELIAKLVSLVICGLRYAMCRCHHGRNCAIEARSKERRRRRTRALRAA